MMCPACNDDAMVSVISFGLPMRLCLSCSCCDGLATRVHELLPWTFNGLMVGYDGTVRGYFRALWHWLWSVNHG